MLTRSRRVFDVKPKVKWSPIHNADTLSSAFVFPSRSLLGFGGEKRTEAKGERGWEDEP
jgi:hypothetical protein